MFEIAAAVVARDNKDSISLKFDSDCSISRVTSRADVISYTNPWKIVDYFEYIVSMVGLLFL
uniref:Uncharacterized protein n=1 Tax=Ciona savignyi TaxID=51511 RepID=H2Y463_CIOSA